MSRWRMIGRLLPKRGRIRQVFDREYYLRNNPDVAAAGIDPLQHYLTHGAAERRQPHPLFDPEHYMAACPGARNAANPLLHFLETGRGPWAATHPLFDSEAYAHAHREVTGNPLVAYLARRNGEPPVEGSQFGQC